MIGEKGAFVNAHNENSRHHLYEIYMVCLELCLCVSLGAVVKLRIFVLHQAHSNKVALALKEYTLMVFD